MKRITRKVKTLLKKKPNLGISVEGAFFLRLAESLINFGFTDLPKDVHFSISWHPKSHWVNFHVTRNTSDQNDKPQIKIIEVRKHDLKENMDKILMAVFGSIYDQSPISYNQALSRKDFYRKVAFMSFDDLSWLESRIPKMWTFKKDKIRMPHTNLLAFEMWLKRPNILKAASQHIYSLPWHHSQKIQRGYLCSPALNGSVLIINGIIYQQREFIDPSNILANLVGESLTKTLTFKTMMAVKRIQTLENWKDSRKFDNPICF